MCSPPPALPHGAHHIRSVPGQGCTLKSVLGCHTAIDLHWQPALQTLASVAPLLRASRGQVSQPLLPRDPLRMPRTGMSPDDCGTHRSSKSALLRRLPRMCPAQSPCLSRIPAQLRVQLAAGKHLLLRASAFNPGTRWPAAADAHLAQRPRAAE